MNLHDYLNVIEDIWVLVTDFDMSKEPLIEEWQPFEADILLLRTIYDTRNCAMLMNNWEGVDLDDIRLMLGVQHLAQAFIAREEK